MIDIQEIEEAEYVESMRRLLANPDFRRVLIAWNQELGQLDLAPLTPDHLVAYNWNAGRAAFIHEVLDRVEIINPGARQTIRLEEIEYVGRRNRSDERG